MGARRDPQADLTARCTVLLSPVTARPAAGGAATTVTSLSPEQLAEWLLADRLDVRLGLQLHKIIWSPTRRGV